MTRNNDPAFEIKSALDREVGRRFDVGRLAAALEEGERERGRRATRSEGPLARVPVSIQWIGVAAAVIAAATGLRSLYLDLTAHEARPAPENRAAVGATHVEDGILAHAGRAREVPAPLTRMREPLEPAFPRRKSDPRPVPRSDRAVGTDEIAAPLPETAHASETAARATPEVPAPIGGGAGTSTSSRPGPEPERKGTGALPQFGVVVAGLPPESVGGVKLESLTFAGRRLVADVREAPEIRATLVTIFGAPGSFPRAAGSALRGPSTGTGASAAAHIGSVPSSSASSAAYYVRLFMGEGFESQAQEEHGVLGKGLRVVPLRELEAWGDDEQKTFLRKTFGLRTVVATGGALLAPPRGEGTVDGKLLVSAGGSFYDVSLRATRADAPGEHRIEVRLSRRLPRGSRPAEAREIGASFLVESGRVVVLGIPDPLLAGEGPTAGPPVTDMAFLALSPRFDEAELPDRLVVNEQAEEPPILIDGPEPRYSEEARELHVAGRVVLRAVVRDDGSVDGVQVLEVPDVPGSENLVAAAASAVREWRYLPARRDGRAVHAYVTITIEFKASYS